MKPLYKVGLLGREQVLRSYWDGMLQSASVYSEAIWQVSDTGPFDLAVCGLFDTVTRADAASVIRVADVSAVDAGQAHLPAGFNVQQLTVQLNRVAQMLTAHTGAKPYASPPNTGGGWGELAEVLYNAKVTGSSDVFRVKIDYHEPILVDVKGQRVWAPYQLGSMCAANSKVTFEVDGRPAESIAKLQSETQPLDILLWNTGLYCSQGVPVSWMRAGAEYKLVAWPDFTCLNHTMEHLSMAACMARRPVNALTLAAATRSNVTEAQNFINAAALMGIGREKVARVAPPPPMTDVQRPARQATATSLMSRLRLKFGF